MFKRLYILILILIGLMQLKAAHAQTYAIQVFRQDIQSFEIEDRRYQSAPSGSYEEQLADQRRRAIADHAKSVIQQYDAFLNIRASENESVFNEFNSQYQAASSGSLRESIFDVARRAAASGLQQNAILEIQSAYDYQQALRLTLIADQKYQAASSGSLIEGVFNQVRQNGFEISKQKLQDFLRYQLRDFREGERLFADFNGRYQSASSGSRVEDFYNFGRQQAAARTLEGFRSEAYRYSYNELRSLESEFNSKFQAASSGSLMESLYRQLRDEVRARLSSVQPSYPTPYPAPQPQPASGCRVMPGRNAAGQVLYRVLDRSSRILLTTTSLLEAQQFARYDAQCR